MKLTREQIKHVIETYIVGRKGVEEIMQTNITNADYHISKDDFPEPIAHLGTHKIWLKSDVIEYNDKVERRKRKKNK